MHCCLIALNNSLTFKNLSELLREVLSARCKFRLPSIKSVFVVTTDTTRLWLSSRLSQYISCLGIPAYPLTKRIVRKALSLSTVMVNIWLPFKQTQLVDLTNILSISVFVKKSSNNSCGNSPFKDRGCFVPCIQLLPYRTINVFPTGFFMLFLGLKAKWKRNSELNYESDKAKSHIKKCEKCRVLSCQQDVKHAKMNLPLILYSSLKVLQLKDLLLSLHLQHLAKYCHLMHKN